MEELGRLQLTASNATERPDWTHIFRSVLPPLPVAGASNMCVCITIESKDTHLLLCAAASACRWCVDYVCVCVCVTLHIFCHMLPPLLVATFMTQFKLCLKILMLTGGQDCDARVAWALRTAVARLVASHINMFRQVCVLCVIMFVCVAPLSVW